MTRAKYTREEEEEGIRVHTSEMEAQLELNKRLSTRQDVILAFYALVSESSAGRRRVSDYRSKSLVGLIAQSSELTMWIRENQWRAASRFNSIAIEFLFPRTPVESQSSTFTAWFLHIKHARSIIIIARQMWSFGGDPQVILVSCEKRRNGQVWSGSELRKQQSKSMTRRLDVG